MSDKLLAVSAACLAAALALTQVPAEAAADDAASAVRARQAAFMLSAATFGSMKPVIDAGGDVSGLQFGARALARWARAIPDAFPAGSGKQAGVPTRALPLIWSERQGFDQAAADYADAADKLADAAKANDKVAFAAQWNAVRQSCSSCHDRYREPEPPRK